MHNNRDAIAAVATEESQRPSSSASAGYKRGPCAQTSVAAAEEAPQCGPLGLQLLQVLLRLLPLPLPVAAACI